MSSPAALPYDEILYPGHAYQATHPDRLAVMGALFGLRPAPVERCRVLELGCGNGANLLPMAYTLPASEFFGLDLAPRPIRQGNAAAAELGLSNLRLQALDLLDFPADAGAFDYVIAHGLYSWVPPAVREKTLAICAAHLAPHGIAYISYKAFPGSYATDFMHRMMRYHASRRPDATPEEIVRGGLKMVRLVIDTRPGNDPFRLLLERRLEFVEKQMQAPGGYTWIYYDLGAEISEPMYFHEFMAQAERQGLQFLSEVTLETPPVARATPAAVAALGALAADVLAQEQTLDVMAHREFRRTLLCRADAVLDRSLPPARIYPLYATGRWQPVAAAPAGGGPGEQEFLSPRGVKLTVNQPTVAAALRRLGQAWPGAVPFDGLLAAGAREEDAPLLAMALLDMFRADMVELTTRPLPLATALGERPVASARVRQQIAHGQLLVTTLQHSEIAVKDEPIRQLLGLLDGTRDRAALLLDLHAWLDQARPVTPDLPPREWIDQNLDKALLSFVRQQFLVA